MDKRKDLASTGIRTQAIQHVDHGYTEGTILARVAVSTSYVWSFIKVLLYFIKVLFDQEHSAIDSLNKRLPEDGAVRLKHVA
jgi:hypothetical protein